MKRPNSWSKSCVPVPLPVTGVMEMRDGRIAQWRDYLDLGTAERGLGLVIHSDAEPDRVG